MNSHAADIRRALLKASPEVRAAVDAGLKALQASFKAALEQRLHEADTARQGWKCEQETSAALRGDIAQLQAELAAVRESMSTAAKLLLLGSSPAINTHAEAVQ